MRSLACVLLLTSALFAQQTADQPKIEDNSFLVEEAYNQEYGVVQHIQNFTRDFETHDYVYSFTQEWPIDLDPRHQFSYTLLGVHNGDVSNGKFGLGDTFLNYRFQLVKNQRLAIAPRASLILPTGESSQGRGLGAVGFQSNFALSFRADRKLTLHSNAGWTVVPNAKDEFGNKARRDFFNLGQSFIWLAKPRFNVLLETVYVASADIVGPGRTQYSHEVLMNPGVRWSYNFKNGTQIVPGVSIPVGVGPSSGRAGIFVYFSVEHAFRKKKG
jgi:hypothetical protein